MLDLHRVERHHQLVNGKELEMGLVPAEKATSSTILSQGIKNPADFMTLMGALMKDISDKRLTPDQGQVIVNAAKEMLKMAEFSYRIRKETR